MAIEVGDYIRANNGIITQITDIHEGHYNIYRGKNETCYVDEWIVKYSKELIDLIEVDI